MNMMTTIARRCDVLVDALAAEFGAMMAARILEAEAADFLWEARVSERYLGQHLDFLGDDEDVSEMSRIAILSHLDGRWHAAICLVDGEGHAVEMLWKRRFESIFEAQEAFDRACRGH